MVLCLSLGDGLAEVDHLHIQVPAGGRNRNNVWGKGSVLWGNNSSSMVLCLGLGDGLAGSLLTLAACCSLKSGATAADQPALTTNTAQTNSGATHLAACCSKKSGRRQRSSSNSPPDPLSPTPTIQIHPLPTHPDLPTHQAACYSTNSGAAAVVQPALTTTLKIKSACNNAQAPTWRPAAAQSRAQRPWASRR